MLTLLLDIASTSTSLQSMHSTYIGWHAASQVLTVSKTSSAFINSSSSANAGSFLAKTWKEET